MLKKLQQKWGVNSLNLLLIIINFAVGGSACGIIGRKIMSLTGLEKGFFWIVLYILIMTLIWPLCVLITSIPLGQFHFFKNYLRKIAGRFNSEKAQQDITGRKQSKENRIDVPVTNLAIFASGAGSNAKKIITHFQNNPNIRVVLLLCNKPGAGALQIAKDHQINTVIIERDRFFNGDGYCPILQQHKVDYIILAGFLWKIPVSILKTWPSSIINIHPALLPKYGGKGMYGAKVHEAVIGNKEVESGISIHYVDEVYDNGEIIRQVSCPVTAEDTPETLAKKIHELEHAHYPSVIEAIVKSKKGVK
jgi:formyltetrahydrofolate-dependent phosphoribosylglycinamide formyltransferase